MTTNSQTLVIKRDPQTIARIAAIYAELRELSRAERLKQIEAANRRFRPLPKGVVSLGGISLEEAAVAVLLN